MPPAGFEHVIPASKRPQIHALDRVATGIRWHLFTLLNSVCALILANTVDLLYVIYELLFPSSGSIMLGREQVLERMEFDSPRIFSSKYLSRIFFKTYK